MFVIIYEEWTPCVVDATEADGVNGLPVPPTDWLGWISSSESASLHRHGGKTLSVSQLYCNTVVPDTTSSQMETIPKPVSPASAF